MPDELLVYDLVRHKAHCLNETAALVWKRCDGKTSVKQMVRVLKAEKDAAADESMVWLAFDQLAKADLLQGESRKWSGASGISRREVIKRIGVAAAVSLPLVTSIVAPTAVQAATCLGSGAGCTSNAQCCSLLCSTGTCA
jgi:hypothetical protein